VDSLEVTDHENYSLSLLDIHLTLLVIETILRNTFRDDVQNGRDANILYISILCLEGGEKVSLSCS
jgi:hypothetical protein